MTGYRFRMVAATCAALICALTLINREARAQETVVRSSDGRATLTIDAGAAPRTVPIRLIATSGNIDPSAVQGAQYRIEPDTVRFSRPATLVVVFDSGGLPGGVSASTLGVARKDGDRWLALGSTVDTIAHTVTTMLGQAGAVSVRWHSPAQHCLGAEYHELDFRLGAWNYRAAGFDPGHTTVVADSSGCALHEQYADVTGGRAFAFFIYVPRDRQWHSTTIDPSGRSLASGGPEAGHFAMYHSPSDREVYTRLPDGIIAFAGERSRDGGHTWAPWFTATYSRDTLPR